MIQRNTAQHFRGWRAVAAAAGVMIAGCGGASEYPTTPEASITPEPSFGTYIESKLWQGWHTYADDRVNGNIFTEFYVYAVKDTLWCGVMKYDLDVPGTYLAYVNDSGEWEVLLEVQEGDPETNGIVMARAYGELLADNSITGWMDHYQDLNISNAEVVPELDPADMDFQGWFSPTWQLQLNPEILTYDELMVIIADATIQERTAAIIPEGESIDLPAFVLTDYSAISLPTQETYCAFCAEP